MARWAIQSTKVFKHVKTGEPVESVHYFRRQMAGFFLEFATADEAMTWPRKVDAEGYMRRVLGRRSGLDGYAAVRVPQAVRTSLRP